MVIYHFKDSLSGFFCQTSYKLLTEKNRREEQTEHVKWEFLFLIEELIGETVGV